MSKTFIGNIDSHKKLVNKRNARKIYLAFFLAMAVGGTIMAVHIYHWYSQPNITSQFGNIGQNGVEMSGLGLSFASGTDEIVPISQGGSVGPFDTVPGTIEVIHAFGPEAPLPLCIDQSVVDAWSVVIKVTGGYTPECGMLKIFQGPKPGECGYRGTLWVTFTEVQCHDGDAVEECCTVKYYEATFTVCQPFCLESNQYPVIDDPSLWFVPGSQTGEIPGKEVWGCWSTKWSGCPLDEQEFVIISVQNNQILDNTIPSPQHHLI